MDIEKQMKAERFINYMKNEIEGDNLQAFIAERPKDDSVWLGDRSVLAEPKNEVHSYREAQSPIIHKKDWAQEGLTVRSEPPEVLANLYDGKNPQFALSRLFGEPLDCKSANEPPAEEEEQIASDDEISERSPRKFNKGLKLLSVIVQDIVIKKQITTYKEVATIILNDTVNNGQLSLTSKSDLAKEEQNIKRRVYDALNVLISAGILVKEGKKVRKNEVNKKIKFSSRQIEIKSLRSAVLQKKQAIAQKLVKINRMKQELDSINKLVERNKAQPSQKYISFPFLIIKPSSFPRTQLKIRKQADDCKIALYSNKEFSVFGDLEIVSMINHQPSQY